MRKFISYAITVLVLTGCSTKIQILYNTEPSGATIVHNGVNYGYSPVWLQYEPDKSFKEGGCTTLQGVTAKWPSGAYKTIPSLRVCAVNSKSQVLTIERPGEVPGREIDVANALELEKIAIMKRQSEAAQMSAIFGAMSTLNQAFPKAQNCSSYMVGNTVQTRCY